MHGIKQTLNCVTLVALQKNCRVVHIVQQYVQSNVLQVQWWFGSCSGHCVSSAIWKWCAFCTASFFAVQRSVTVLQRSVMEVCSGRDRSSLQQLVPFCPPYPTHASPSQPWMTNYIWSIMKMRSGLTDTIRGYSRDTKRTPKEYSEDTQRTPKEHSGVREHPRMGIPNPKPEWVITSGP